MPSEIKMKDTNRVHTASEEEAVPDVGDDTNDDTEVTCDSSINSSGAVVTSCGELERVLNCEVEKVMQAIDEVTSSVLSTWEQAGQELRERLAKEKESIAVHLISRSQDLLELHEERDRALANKRGLQGVLKEHVQGILASMEEGDFIDVGGLTYQQSSVQ